LFVVEGCDAKEGNNHDKLGDNVATEAPRDQDEHSLPKK
jgi:hypothetical protein